MGTSHQHGVAPVERIASRPEHDSCCEHSFSLYLHWCWQCSVEMFWHGMSPVMLHMTCNSHGLH